MWTEIYDIMQSSEINLTFAFPSLLCLVCISQLSYRARSSCKLSSNQWNREKRKTHPSQGPRQETCIQCYSLFFLFHLLPSITESSDDSEVSRCADTVDGCGVRVVFLVTHTVLRCEHKVNLQSLHFYMVNILGLVELIEKVTSSHGVIS